MDATFLPHAAPSSPPAAAPPPHDYLAEVFGPRGPFAARVPGYEPRAAQLALARVIDQALREGRAALAEAPCGTGKSFAYGVPAVYHATQRRKRVVIATENIALQEQLVHKDLPQLAAVLPWRFGFALLKGRGNYLCLDRMRGDDALSFTLDEASAAKAIESWARTTSTGDAAELPFAVPPPLWSKLSVGPEVCKRDGCRFQGPCFAERARREAAEADVVVTNYHLLFAHLAVRRATGRDLVLPPFDALVCDEAHEAADIAREFFGFAVGPPAVAQLAYYAFRLGLAPLADLLRTAGDALFLAAAGHARSEAYRVRLESPGFVDASPLLTAVRALERAATTRDAPGNDKEARAVARNVARLARTCAANLEEAVAQGDANKVYWVELDARGRGVLRAKPIDVADVLRAELFGKTSAVVLTSATLATGGHFGFARRELGVPSEALEVCVESPFDYAHQARLIIPRALPDPNDPGFVDAVAASVQSVVDQCDGRTLGLFASHQTLAAVHARMAQTAQRHRVLRQGELPRAELTRIFKSDVHSVLLGTNSFRTGLDVPGEALTGLVIDKLPFPPPTDPVVHAIHARNPRAFLEYSLPKAIIALKQGVGRLIRTRRDVGVVVILDARLHTRRYRGLVLGSLPPMPRGTELSEVGAFLARRERARGAPAKRE